MADQKISELNAKTTVHDTDIFPIVDIEAETDETKQITGANLKSEVLAGHKDLTTGVHGATDYQGRRIQLFNPYQPKDNRYKVQLHTHTTESDGADTPATLMAAYEAAGYDAVAITDHNILTADPGGHGILHIPSVEEGYLAGNMLNLFATAAQWNTDLAITLGKILLDGALAAPAHAWWPNNPISTPTLLNLLSFQLLEIVNHAVSPVYDDSQFLSLLTGNKNIWAIGCDDCHDIAGAAFNKCFVEIMANELSLSALQESLRDGNFYVRQTGAPQLTITISGNTITCAMGADSNIEWIGRDGLVLKSEDDVVTSDYVIKGWEGFVLARVIDNATTSYRSWTQPIFILSPSTTPQGIDRDHAALTTGVHGAGLDYLVNSKLFVPISGEIIRLTHIGEPSPFTAKINGNPTSTSVPYDTDTNDLSLSGLSSGATYWGRIMLYNSTRETYRKIVAAYTSANEIITEDTSDAWADNDDITTQSQVNTTAGYFDVDLSAEIPAAAKFLGLFVLYQELAGAADDASRTLLYHPYETYNVGKRFYVFSSLKLEASTTSWIVPVISQKITLFFRNASADMQAVALAKGYI